MIGRRPRPMIGKLSELLVSGNNKPRPIDVVGTSPRSPLDAKTPSPRSLKRYDAGHGVGLGIVAALDKTVCGSDLIKRSNPIVISPCKNRARYGDSDMDSLEDYTYVTSHGPGKSSSTKVYYDGAATTTTPRHDTKGCFGAVKEIPAPALAANKRLVVEEEEEEEEEEEVFNYYYPTSDFLSSCHQCRKQLHGKDIYMYRGEKGFCSTECRSKQIMMDERKEQCRPEASRSANNNNKVSNSSYNKDQIFSTGILAL